jgi:hypothetical protein
MAARILRIELRRSVALLAAFVIAATGAFVLFASNPPYGSWMELVILQRDILQLTWPLALAAGAWQGIRERRSRVEELFATTPRPRRWRVLPVATAMAIAAAAAYLVMLAGAAGHLKRLDGYFSLGAIPLIALGALAMVAAVWLGLAIGTLLPSPLTAPILAVVGFVSLAMSPMVVAGGNHRDPGTFLLFPYLQGPRDAEFSLAMLSPRANLAQALWLAAVAAAGLALFAAARPGTRVAAFLPVVLGAAIAVPAMPRQLSTAWIDDRRATELVCTSDEPRVCVSRVQSHALEQLRGPARRALSVLAAKLPPGPTRVEARVVRDDIPRGPQPADTIQIFVAAFVPLTEYRADNILLRLLDGAGTRPCVNQLGLDPTQPTDGQPPEPNERYEAARRAASEWLLGRTPQPSPKKEGSGDFVRDALIALYALPADEQRARVAALRAAELTCAEGDRLALLTGTSETR